MQKKTYNILIADDHPLIRAGLRTLLKTSNKFKVVAEGKNGNEALELIDQHNPDIVVLDIDMPEKSGIEVAGFVRVHYPETRVVFLTSHSSFNTFSEAIKLHYSGFIFKESALEELMECLEKVSRNENYCSPLFKDFLAQNQSEVDRLDDLGRKLRKLTPTEQKIIKLIGEGKTTSQVASILFNSEKTIENHRYNICIKLEVKGNNNLLAFALENRKTIQNILE